ncbi:N-acetylmuramidase family protein [Utexia brackfieldae]|uniref:N-acetylmuramidase family protein n=1 Tax=Utexia brackfieldae TaxID=3074108 RepID=UPI00370DADBE
MDKIIDYLKECAEKLGINYFILLAVAKVEANTKGFIADGKPTILFERHIFYKQLKKQGFNVDQLTNQYPTLINKTPGGYLGGQRENYRLQMAKQINESCAIESASFGLFQIMGFHWQALGYSSPQQFELAMSKSEIEQTEAFIRFISLPGNIKMIAALKQEDFATFARLYNGPAYKKNRYDEKIEEAYDAIKNAH